MLSQTVNSSIEIKRLSDNTVLTISLEPENKLGHGSFGCAYHLSHPLHPELLVCKIIDLQGKSAHYHLPPHQLLRLTYRELTYLKKVNMLIGYWHDEQNQKMYVLMKFIRGRPEYAYNKVQNPQIESWSFRALRKLHRHGIAHMDPHQGNFLIQRQQQSATAIDFGLAKDHHFFRELRDLYRYLIKRKQSATQVEQEVGLTINQLIQFYSEELAEYITNNKLAIAKNVFIYSAIIVAAISGVSVLGAASLIAQQLIQNVLLKAVSELLEAVEDHYELRAWNQIHSLKYRRFYYCVVGLLVVLQGFLTALSLSNLYTSVALVWQQCVQLVLPLELAHIALQMKPLVHALHYWKEECEKYLFKTSWVSSYYQHQIAQGSAHSVYLPQYTHLTSISTDDSQQSQSSLTSSMVIR